MNPPLPTSACVLSRRETAVSPWVKLVEKHVRFTPEEDPQVYHAVAQATYITILAITPEGRIPIVRQFRPAVEQYTWELPAGLLEPGESPPEACQRELLEETGLRAQSVKPLGSCFVDTGRMENRQLSFLVEASPPDLTFVPEPGTAVEYVSLAELKALIRSGEFCLQLHVGVVLLYDLLASSSPAQPHKEDGAPPVPAGSDTPSDETEAMAMLRKSLAQSLGRTAPLTEQELSSAMLALSELLDRATEGKKTEGLVLPAAVRPLLLHHLFLSRESGNLGLTAALETAFRLLAPDLRRKLRLGVQAIWDANRPSEHAPNRHWIFDHFRQFPGEAPDHMVLCYVGTKTRPEFFVGSNFSPPIPEINDEYFEWLDILQAVHEAGDCFTMLELGAGFGRWTSRAALAARQRGITRLRLGLAEAEPAHIQWLKTHMEDNGIGVEEYQLFESAVAGVRGEMMFAVTKPEGSSDNNPAAWYGQGAMPGTAPHLECVGKYHGHPLFRRPDGWGVIKVPQVRFRDILEHYDFVDIADLDIQGMEADAIEEAIEEVTRKVRRLHIGTHGVEIEERLATVLSSTGWICLRDYSLQREHDTPFGRCWFNDGVQTWLNPNLASS